MKVLWVQETSRRQGIASALLEMEARATGFGCHGAWLDSSNPDAVLWYSRRGYEPFGELANDPETIRSPPPCLDTEESVHRNGVSER